MALSVTPGGGSGEQSNPQTAVSGNTGTVAGSNVQPGTPTQQLNSSSGVTLHDQPLTTVNLSAGTAKPAASAAKTAAPHLNPILLIAAVLLFLVAAASFWAIGRSSKKHNQY